ncbi:2-dehydro-3-deoxy-6-phosphogalactonate aldolase [Variovorax dokdonensis]|uniref:2-dehydro-3-deoxy-6-phosphogalactonate aldolase n=1 Tax=Variovorax dokdonensis TaxID=344883 RepID=A0ABT7N7J7_9BURK|nr:2-dehydro-3-deoxy-6-phosphogalactonate aldolase [Variovorax dokdonensis]MDM0043916.1 2-dehydro-3-deoxy-6-phosphogalactonate aldolase [Variovorax dokdonensis]
MSSIQDKFDKAMAQLPLVAILRGLTPQEAAGIGDALVEAGFGLIEVPLNSPQPLESIALLRQRHPQAVVGAGTVLNTRQVLEVAAAGGELVVSPDAKPAVIAASRQAGLISLPGVMTPTEAFAALDAGAHGLKIFPAEMASPAVVKALLAVLPAGTPILPVGGISPGNMAQWQIAGAAGFGIGSALYKPGKSATAVREDAHAFVAAYRGQLRA